MLHAEERRNKRDTARMTKRFVLIVFLLFAPIAAAIAGSVSLFDDEAEAQKHCPNDIVVWVNTPSGVYHFKGMRWYGTTNHGAYVCQKDGDQAGYRATRNGQ
jgi:hypothetical protein